MHPHTRPWGNKGDKALVVRGTTVLVGVVVVMKCMLGVENQFQTLLRTTAKGGTKQ